MYDSLINQINTYIRDNATNDISGGGLNVILRSMLDALGIGMRFYGIATTGTTPVSNQYPKFYIAFKPDTYSNFNIVNYPKFTSGFAIIYDENGTNTWLMAVKPFESNGTSGYLVNAQVRKNKYPADARFYIGNARVTNGLSTFTVYSTTENNLETDAIAAVFTSEEQLTGLITHRVVGVNGTIFYVSVDWDKLIFNDETTFSYSETRFPSEAYVDTSDDADFEEMLQPVYFDFNADVAISDITNQILQNSFTQQDVANLMEYKKLNKNVHFRLRYLDSEDLRYIDLQEFLPYVRASFSELTNDSFYELQEVYEITLVSKKYNEYFTIKLTVQYNKIQEDDFLDETFHGSVAWNLDYTSNPQLLRTVNDEPLNDNKSNINVHDGFFFPNAVRDFEGNWYSAVVIGSQVWLAENIRSVQYYDGSKITYSYPNNNQGTGSQFGLLYDYLSATKVIDNKQGIYLENFHFPTHGDVIVLREYLKKQTRVTKITGSLAKSLASTDGWAEAGNQNKKVPGYKSYTNNITGFNAKPAGIFRNNSVYQFGSRTAFWLLDLNGNYAKCFEIHNDDPAAGIDTSVNKNDKLSLRYVSDLLPYQFRNWYIQQYGSLQHII